MFLVELTYQGPLERIDELLDEHYNNPHGLFALGMVRLAGRLEPRTGGLMVVEGERAEVEAALAADPFIVNGVATARIVEFHPTRPWSGPTG
ncbi:YciI family protein [Pseudonocardia spinosispora]|uniref:YciI family protein n=1 Tax=Pseudonocardia spinosispora TaxID=103441 RepID=UPI00048E7F10|nr:YciI family protein [Pseudonocardia spinosispora]